jgi:hypothetical protein
VFANRFWVCLLYAVRYRPASPRPPFRPQWGSPQKVEASLWGVHRRGWSEGLATWYRGKDRDTGGDHLFKYLIGTKSGGAPAFTSTCYQGGQVDFRVVMNWISSRALRFIAVASIHLRPRLCTPLGATSFVTWVVLRAHSFGGFWLCWDAIYANGSASQVAHCAAMLRVVVTRSMLCAYAGLVACTAHVGLVAYMHENGTLSRHTEHGPELEPRLVA